MDGGIPNPPSNPPDNNKGMDSMEEYTIGGKIWKVDPNRTYYATGVWTNPHPRSLTTEEQTRLESILAEIETLNNRLECLFDEADFLERIEKPEIRVNYSFGMPLHRSNGDIIDLGEFSLALEIFNATPTEP